MARLRHGSYATQNPVLRTLQSQEECDCCF